MKTTIVPMKQGVVVYQYILTYVGNLSFSEGTGVVGVNHADDLLYLWNFLDYPIYGDDIAVQQIMTQAWTDFATFGDPTPPGSEFSWTPLGNVSYNNFWNISGPNPAMEHNEYIQERMEAWKYILDEVPTTTEPTTTEKSTALSNQPLGIFLLLVLALSFQINI